MIRLTMLIMLKINAEWWMWLIWLIVTLVRLYRFMEKNEQETNEMLHREACGYYYDGSQCDDDTLGGGDNG